MNEVEKYYLQHFGVKGMKWGVRKKRDPSKVARKQEAKQSKKANKTLYKEAKRDVRNVRRGHSSFNMKRVKNAEKEIRRKSKDVEGYKEANKKAQKASDRNVRANRIGALALMTLSVAMQTHPEAVLTGTSVVSSALRKTASTTGMYAKYAAKAAVPVSRTVKNRGYIDAILVNAAGLSG